MSSLDRTHKILMTSTTWLRKVSSRWKMKASRTSTRTKQDLMGWAVKSCRRCVSR